jgi:hypothetical protein
MHTEPQLVHRVPPFNFEAVQQLGTGAIEQLVATLSVPDVFSPRSALISRLRPKLLMQAPELRLDDAAESEMVVDGGEPSLHVEIEVPIDDPSGLARLVNRPNVSDLIEFRVDEENGLVRVVGYFNDLTKEYAFLELAQALSEYRRNIDRMAQQIERYNTALPYLISASIQARVDEHPDLAWPGAKPRTRIEIQCVIDDMAAEGRVVAIYAPDSLTGELRLRHYL